MSYLENDTPLPVPYTSRLRQPLETGQTLNIHGKINDGAQVAAINFLRGGSEIGPNTQVILHLKLSFMEKNVILNSYENGEWKKEEREFLPFQAGQEFDLRIRVLYEGFEISADNKKIHEFKHRLPFQSIEYLSVYGDLSLNRIHWGGRFYGLPWETAFPAGYLGKGQHVHLYGIPKGNRWSLNLVARNQDILFHFNPRLDEKAIVRNSQRNGCWEFAEREGGFPFQKDVGFDLTIVNEEYFIQIFINRKRFGTFQHRTQNPIGDYIGLRIVGEVEVTGIEFSH